MLATISFLMLLQTAAGHISQKPLQPDSKGPTFIQSSIFRNIDITNQHHIDEPVFLPPTYRARGAEAEYTFQGLLTFGHLEYNECTSHKSNNTFDIAIVGHPFDLGVSYRPGARFGPNGAREGARRLAPGAGWEYVMWLFTLTENLTDTSYSTDHKGVNPFKNWAKVVDCGDIDNNPFEKLIAVKELEKGIAGITKQTPKNTTASNAVRVVSIGGDHTISKSPSSLRNIEIVTDLNSSAAHPTCSLQNMGSSRCVALRLPSRHLGSASTRRRTHQIRGSQSWNYASHRARRRTNLQLIKHASWYSLYTCRRAFWPQQWFEMWFRDGQGKRDWCYRCQGSGWKNLEESEGTKSISECRYWCPWSCFCPSHWDYWAWRMDDERSKFIE